MKSKARSSEDPFQWSRKVLATLWRDWIFSSEAVVQSWRHQKLKTAIFNHVYLTEEGFHNFKTTIQQRKKCIPLPCHIQHLPNFRHFCCRNVSSARKCPGNACYKFLSLIGNYTAYINFDSLFIVTVICRYQNAVISRATGQKKWLYDLNMSNLSRLLLIYLFLLYQTKRKIAFVIPYREFISVFMEQHYATAIVSIWRYVCVGAVYSRHTEVSTGVLCDNFLAEKL